MTLKIGRESVQFCDWKHRGARSQGTRILNLNLTRPELWQMLTWLPCHLVSKLWSTVSTHGLGRYSSEREGASGGRLEANTWPIQWAQPACVYFIWRRLRRGEHLAFFPFEVWCWLLRFPQVLASWMDGEGVLKRWVVMTLEMYAQGSREHRETQQFCWIWRPGGWGWGA